MADGLHGPYFDAPLNPSNDNPAGDDGGGREPWMGVLVPTVIVAVSALVVAGLVDKVARRVDPDRAVVVDSGGDPVPDQGDGGATRDVDVPGLSVFPGRAHRPPAGLTGAPGGPVEVGPEHAWRSLPAGSSVATVAPDVPTTSSTVRHEIRTTTSASTTAEPVTLETNERYRRFVAETGLGDIDFITPHLAHGTRVTEDQRVNVLILDHLETAGIRVSPGDRAPVPVGAWAAEIGAQAAINANWFSAGGGFDGPFVADGIVYGGHDHHYTALFGFTADKRLVTEHHSVVNDSVDDRVVEAVAGHPTLVDRGRVTTDFGEDPTFTRRHPRTAIGAADGGDIVIFVTVDGRSVGARGMTGAETAALMAGLGASHAVMLDGGGSSALWIEGRGVVNGQSDPGRRVGNQIAIFGR